MKMKIDIIHEYKRAIIFKTRQSLVHVVKVNGIFYNGIIKEVNTKWFILDDRENGDQYILFNELKKSIELFKIGDNLNEWNRNRF